MKNYLKSDGVDHLTSEEMDVLLLDSRTSDSGSLDSESRVLKSRDRLQHLSDCGTCSAEFESLRMVMGDLRMAAIASAEQHRRAAVMLASSHRTPQRMWALVTAAMLICVAGTLTMRDRPTRVVAVSAPAQRVQGDVSDEQLLSDVQDDLSSPMPKQMLPLVASVASTSGSGYLQRKR